MTARDKGNAAKADSIISKLDGRAKEWAMTYIEGFVAGYEASKGDGDEKETGEKRNDPSIF